MQSTGASLPTKQRHLSSTQQLFQGILAPAGITINGDNPYDIQISDNSVFQAVIAHGSLGLGETYMDGKWNTESLDEFIYRLLQHEVDEKVHQPHKLGIFIERIKHKIINPQSKKRAYQVAEQHYNIGNDVFEVMLDRSLCYSCGYWRRADTLDQAQHDKLDLICRKLDLSPGEHLLDIGCGWGSLAYHAAKYYGAHVTGITISTEQQEYAEQRCRDLPVNIHLMDYRDIQNKYDKIASVGMFEHVGPRNYTNYFSTVSRALNPGGLFLLHTIGIHATSKSVDPWINKYIFPNGKLPSAEEITRASNDMLIVEDWHNFAKDYDKTLMAWWKNFATGWPQLEPRYDHRFYRMWEYYLKSCAGFFRSPQGQLWQVVFSNKGDSLMYQSVR